MEVFAGLAAINAWLYVFARFAGWAFFDPLLGRLPVVLRLLCGAALAAALLPGAAVAGVPEAASFTGLFALAGEVLSGAFVALGVRIVFAAVLLALTSFGALTGAGLVTLTEPQAQVSQAAVRQLAWWLGGLAFLAAGGHLLVVDALRASLAHVPAGAFVAHVNLREAAEGAGWLFLAGSQLALPLLVMALLLHLALGILARTDPAVGAAGAPAALGALLFLAGLLWMVPAVAAVIESGLLRLVSWLGGLR